MAWPHADLTYSGTQLTRVQDQTSRLGPVPRIAAACLPPRPMSRQVTTYNYTSAGALTGLITKTVFARRQTRPPPVLRFVGPCHLAGRSSNNTFTVAYDA